MLGALPPEPVVTFPGEDAMRYVFLILALIFAVIWVIAFLAYHVIGFFIHILLILAFISLLVHFLRPPRSI